MNITCKYDIDECACECLLSYLDEDGTPREDHILDPNVPGLLAKVSRRITRLLEDAGINTGWVA